jgi:ParB family chromosome partitioning protein
VTAVDDIDITLVHPHPRNPRRDLGDLAELTASIKDAGIRSPLHVLDDVEQDRYIVVAGHRRLAAAKAAGLKTVPAIVRRDVKTDAAALVEMAVENLNRADLTPIEEAVLFEQLQIAGMKPTAIAKKTGRKKQTVEARLALMTLPEPAREAVHGAQLSLEDAAALVEFADDPAEVARLTKAAGTQNFRWDLQNARNRRSNAKAREATRAALTAAGVTIVDQPNDWWMKTLRGVMSGLVDVPDGASSEQADEIRRAAHADCPHHAAYIETNGTPNYLCLTPSVHSGGGDPDDEQETDAEHAARMSRASSSPGQSSAADHAAVLAKQAKEREDCETAAGIRKAFIVEHATNARQISALAADDLGRLWAHHAIEFYVEVDPATAADFFALDLTEAQRDDVDEAAKLVQHYVEKRTGAQALLAALAAVHEDNLSRAGNWGTWPTASIAPGSTERRWLDFLVDELGYDLTEWERERLDAADKAAIDRAAATAAEEAAGDEDDREQDGAEDGDG